MNSMFGSKGFANAIRGVQGSTGAGGINNSTGFYKEKIPKGYRMGQYQNFDPAQMDLYQSLFPYLNSESDLANLAGGDEEMFQHIEAPAFRQFNELQGNIASRFSQPGTGARKSSGFQNYMNQAGSNFAQDLQSQRQNLQRQALQDLFGLSNQLMGQRPMEKLLYEKQQKQPSGWGGLIGAGLGGVGGFLAGGPGGAMTGAKLGYGIGSSF